jgi:hypothetical protein
MLHMFVFNYVNKFNLLNFAFGLLFSRPLLDYAKFSTLCDLLFLSDHTVIFVDSYCNGSVGYQFNEV